MPAVRFLMHPLLERYQNVVLETLAGSHLDKLRIGRRDPPMVRLAAPVLQTSVNGDLARKLNAPTTRSIRGD